MDRKLGDERGRIAAIRRLDIFDTPKESAFEHITALVRTALRVPMAAVSLLDTDRQWFKACPGIAVTETPREFSFCEHTARGRETMVVEDATADPRFRENPLVTGAPHIRSYAGAPLTLPDGYQAGALCAIDTVPRTFSPTEREFLAQLSVCVVNELELRQRASRDDLTGFMCRYPFFTRLEAMRTAFVTRGTPATLAFLDLDHFKAVNDRFGHDAGDLVIATVAEACRRVLPADVQFGRIGGEEFALAFPGFGTDRATPLLAALRRAVADLAFPDVPGLRVTASIGVAGLHAGIANVSVWCKMADAALYGAKQAGRNRVIVCDDTRSMPQPSARSATLPYLRLDDNTNLAQFARTAAARGAA